MYLVAGSTGQYHAKRLAQTLPHSRMEVAIQRFQDGEIRIRTHETDMKHQDVCILQSTTHDAMVETCLLLNALRHAGTRHLILCIPYFGYGRHDQPPHTGGAACMARLLEAAGATHVILIEPHSSLVPSFFQIPTSTVLSTPLFAQHVKEITPDSPLIVSPDKGGVARAAYFAQLIDAPLVTMHKERLTCGRVKMDELLDSVAEKTCFLIDDLVDSGETLFQAARFLRKKGAKKVYAYVTHGVFSHTENLTKLLGEEGLDHLILTDSLPLPQKIMEHSKVHILSLTPLLIENLSKFTPDPR